MDTLISIVVLVIIFLITNWATTVSTEKDWVAYYKKRKEIDADKVRTPEEKAALKQILAEAMKSTWNFLTAITGYNWKRKMKIKDAIKEVDGKLKK